MNHNDLKMLRNWLRQTERGTIWQRVAKMFGGSDNYSKQIDKRVDKTNLTDISKELENLKAK